MIDVGMLASMAVLVAIPVLFVRPWPVESAAAGLLDVAGGALFVGLVVGRLSALTLDDPGSLLSVSDVLVIRSGVEFWPGVFAATVWLGVSGRRDGVGAVSRVAAVAPAGLLSWACYEATCLIRDGCPGPISSIGLRPDGLTHRMFPIGLVVAVAAIVCAVVLGRLQRQGIPSPYIAILAVAAIAGIRTVASIWLPHIGRGITRQHRESIVVLTISAVALTTMLVRSRRPSSDQRAASHA